jgi:hypothetical protein
MITMAAFHRLNLADVMMTRSKAIAITGHVTSSFRNDKSSKTKATGEINNLPSQLPDPGQQNTQNNPGK